MATPTVTGIDIASGPPGTTVVIYGANFDHDVSDVSFGAYSVGDNFLVLGEDEIAAIVPEGSGTNLTVYVTNDDGTGSMASLWTYDDNEGGPGGGGGHVPVISDIDPDVSAYEGGVGGDIVYIYGSYFTTAVYVRFGDTPASFRIISDTQIEAIAPPGWGVVEVNVENAYGQNSDPGSANNFTYPTFNVPTITQAISPNTGIAGQHVLITGTDFATVNAVEFGSYGAVFSVLSETQIDAVAPYGPSGTVNVTVTNPSGTSAEPSTPTWNDFTYIGTVTGLTATPMANAVLLKWNPVSHLGAIPVSYRVYVGTADPPTTLIATTSQTSIVYPISHDDGLRYYAVSWVDSYGNESAKCAAVSCTADPNTVDEIAEGAIDSMKLFSAGLTPPRVVANLPALPDDEYPVGSLVFLTGDLRLYRNAGGGPHTNADSDKATWYDLSGNSRDGTLTNFSWDDDGWAGDGLARNSYRLTTDGGGTNYVVLPAISSLSDKTMTLEVWVTGKSSVTPESACFIYFGSTTTYFYVGLSASSTSQRVFCAYKDSGNASQLSSTAVGQTQVYDDVWHHVVGVWNGTTQQVWFDGVKVGERSDLTSGSITINGGRLGSTGFATPSAFFKNGAYAAARVYDVPLSADEIAANAACGPTGLTYKKTDLLLDYSAKRAKVGDAWLPAVDLGESAGTVSGTQITGNSITAGCIAAGAIRADELAADSVMSRSLFVGSFDNLVPNPTSEMDATGKDTSASSPDYEFRGVVAINPYVGNNSRRLLGVTGGTSTMDITRPIPVRPGERYYFEAYARLHSASGSARIKLRCRNASGTDLTGGNVQTDAITSTTYTLYKMKDGSGNPYYEIPATGVDLAVYFYTDNIGGSNALYVDEMIMRQMLTGKLIVDGEILGTHIKAGETISSPVISGGSITGDTVTVTTKLSLGQGGVIEFASGYGTLRTAPVGSSRIELVGAGSPDLIAFKTESQYEAFHGYVKSSASGYTSSLELAAPVFGARWGEISLGSTYEGTGSVLLKASDDAYMLIKEDASDNSCKLSYVGALYPSDWVSGTSWDGVWIQNSNTNQPCKLYWDSNTKRLFIRQSGGVYSFIEIASTCTGYNVGW